MKRQSFWWRWGDEPLVADTVMTRARAAAMIRAWRRQRDVRLDRVACGVYRVACGVNVGTMVIR